MLEVNVTISYIHSDGLTAALQSALGTNKALGVSSYGSNRPISVWLADSASPLEQQQAAVVAQAHDPVFLSVDKTHVAANGVDTAIVTVFAPKPAALVTLLIGSTSVPVTLANGVGSISIVSNDPASIPISVQNPANRTTDTLIVEAI